MLVLLYGIPFDRCRWSGVNSGTGRQVQDIGYTGLSGNIVCDFSAPGGAEDAASLPLPEASMLTFQKK